MSKTRSNRRVNRPESNDASGSLAICWLTTPLTQTVNSANPSSVAAAGVERADVHCLADHVPHEVDLGQCGREALGGRLEPRYGPPEHQLRDHRVLDAPARERRGPRAEPRDRVRDAGAGVRHERVQLFVAPPEQLVVDGESRREVLVERGGADPHLPCDRRERQRAHADVGHLREGESEDLVDRLLPPPLPAVRCRCRSCRGCPLGCHTREDNLRPIGHARG